MNILKKQNTDKQNTNIVHHITTQNISNDSNISLTNSINCFVILLAAGSGTRIRDALVSSKTTNISSINTIDKTQNLESFNAEPKEDLQTNPLHSKISPTKKQFLPYQNAPLWWHSVLTFHACPYIKGMVIVFPNDDEYDETVADAKKRHFVNNLSFPLYFTRGGEKRHQSVYNGLNVLPKNLNIKNPISHLLIHDSARPFFTNTLVHNLLETMFKNPHIHALIPAISLNDTIKIIQDNTPHTNQQGETDLFTKKVGTINCEIVASTPERHLLRAVQTPQAFHAYELIQAHEKIHKLENQALKATLEENSTISQLSTISSQTTKLHTSKESTARQNIPPITDDAMIMEYCGYTVHLISGEEENVKITHPKDLALLETKPTQVPCSGYGYDVHRFGGDRPFILGGISIPTELKIHAHSDGDVLLHALMDALLSCLCLGDIGTHFPDTDKKFENISSSLLLDHVMSLWHKSGLTLCHVDLTIITQKPKIAPFAKEITKNIARLLSICPSCINTKATTEEKLGFTGEGLGIKAVALVSALK